jgi:tagatose 6-phosphate kinase
MILFIGTTPTVQRTMLFEKLRIDAVNRAATVHEYASGKSINAARAAQTLGESVLATGFLGGDAARVIRSDLAAAGVPHDFVDVEPSTRQCVTVIDESAHSATELIEESKEVVASAYDELLEKVTALAATARVVVMSGTLPPGAPQNFYARVIATASRARCIVDATGSPLAAAMEKRPFLVKPNRLELCQSLDVEIDDVDSLHGAMREAIARGARWVVVTSGTDPTWLTDGGRFWRIDVPAIDAISPIGSGDAMAGGIAVGLVRGMDVPEACRLGTACAAANALTPCAGHVDHGDVERLHALTRVSPV